ncbi:hypothetical protein CDD83_10317 [Cordyceps sp. RAO-2017]|nr:hypothetical protein CDD83_10317 [Cordyceps sp. RAO-2017]
MMLRTQGATSSTIGRSGRSKTDGSRCVDGCALGAAAIGSKASESAEMARRSSMGPGAAALASRRPHPFVLLDRTCRASDFNVIATAVRVDAATAAGSASRSVCPTMKSSLASLASLGSVGSICSSSTVPKAPPEHRSAPLIASQNSS